jgi:ceramide glucosyltransferase
MPVTSNDGTGVLLMNEIHPTWSSWLLSFFTFSSVLVYAYGTSLALWRRFRAPSLRVAFDELKISVLKPMSGLDPRLRENLESFARLRAAPGFEVILCLASQTDACYPVAREFCERYPRLFRLSLGANSRLGNAKMAQLSVGFPLAKNPFIWISESNVETTQEAMESLMACWKEVNANGRSLTFVHAPLVAVYGDGIGAAIERMHLSSFQNANHEVALIAGAHAVVGKTEFVHRDDLLAVGGIEAFGNYLGEDFMFGKVFAERGVVRCASEPTRNVLGSLSVKAWFDRHARWAVMRRTMAPAAFHVLEPTIYPAIPMIFGIVGLISPWVALSILGFKMVVDLVCYAVFARALPRLIDAAVIPLKELLLFAAWVNALTTFHVKWRADRAIRLGRNSVVLSKNAEPSRFKRRWNQVRRLLGDEYSATGN